jgi:hypothetical protein
MSLKVIICLAGILLLGQLVQAQSADAPTVGGDNRADQVTTDKLSSQKAPMTESGPSGSPR